LQDTKGTYDTGPWSSLKLDAIDTFMDYYTVIYGPNSFNYSITYGYDSAAIPAICVHGKNFVQLFQSLAVCVHGKVIAELYN
jgi:hypothetical protein